MEKLFKLKEKGTSVKTEILAGLTTFLAMAYILGVNPIILGMPVWIKALYLWQQPYLQHSPVLSWDLWPTIRLR